MAPKSPSAASKEEEDKPPSSDEEEGEAEEEEKAPEGAGRPLGPTAVFELSASYPYECRGSEAEVNAAAVYCVGEPHTEAGLLLCADLSGWNAGRVRFLADYWARALNCHVALPKLYDRPPFREGEDGLPAGVDAESAEARQWLKKYDWDSGLRPRVLAAATQLRRCGAKRIAALGFGIGAWVACRAAAVLGELVCNVLISPKIHAMQELAGRALSEIELKAPTLFLLANGDPEELYGQKGELVALVKGEAESVAFAEQRGGWLTHGDAGDTKVRDSVVAGAHVAAKFLRKFLWPHPPGADGGTLRLRAKEGDEKDVLRLLNMGVPAGGKDAVDDLGLAPLHYAARAGHFALVNIFAEYEADVNVHGGIGRETPLHITAGLNHVRAARSLLGLKASVHEEDKAGQTPLHHAAKAGALPVVRALVDARAALDARDTSQQSPLHLAAWKGKEDVVRLLLEARVDLELTDLRVFTAYDRATQQGFESIAQLLERERVAREEREHAAASVAGRFRRPP